MQQASKDMAMVPGFQQALRGKRANFLRFAELWPDEMRFEKRGTQNIMFAIKPAPPQEEPPALLPQYPQVALAPRLQEPAGESREERNARLDALLAANRANIEAAKERAKQQKNAFLTQLRASRPRTERDFAPP